MANYQPIAALVNQISVDTWDLLWQIKERCPAILLRAGIATYGPNGPVAEIPCVYRDRSPPLGVFRFRGA
jgi:hypothetical protein